MARSIKKGPYVFDRLLKKVKVLNVSAQAVMQNWKLPLKQAAIIISFT